MMDQATARQIAFQPLIDGDTGAAFAFQAQASTPRSVSLLSIADQLVHDRYRLDAAIGAAVAAGIGESDALLTLPLTPFGASVPQLAQLLRAALAHRFPVDRLVVEVRVDGDNDPEHLEALLEACSARGIAVAFDGFSAGPAALRLLARFNPRFVKLDTGLTRNIDRSALRQKIVEGVLRLARAMAVPLVAQDIATGGELATLYTLGVGKFQGEWLAPAWQQARLPARPGTRTAPPPRREPRTQPPRRPTPPQQSVPQQEALVSAG